VRLLGAVAFIVLGVALLLARPGALRAADPPAPAPTLHAADAPFIRSNAPTIEFMMPTDDAVAAYRLSNDSVAANGILTNGTSVPAASAWTVAPGPDGPRTVYGQVRYASGAWSPIVSLAFTLDTSPGTSLAVEGESGGPGPQPPAGYDWHTRTTTPATQITGQGSSDGTPDPQSVAVGDGAWYVILETAGQPIAVGTHDVNQPISGECDGACAAVGAGGHFCEAKTGSFTIHDVSFTRDGDLVALDADFHLQCFNALRSGSIRYGENRAVVALDQDADALLFGDVDLGVETAKRSVTFTNIGTVPTTLGNAAFDGGDDGDFAITTDECSGATLAVGESCAVGVRFTPSANGQRRTDLDIPDDTPGGSRHVMVQGFGFTPTTTHLEVSAPDIGPAPGTITVTVSPAEASAPRVFVDGTQVFGIDSTDTSDASQVTYTLHPTFVPGSHSVKAIVDESDFFRGSSDGPVAVRVGAVPLTAGTVSIAGGATCTNSRVVRVTAKAAPGDKRLELSNSAGSGYHARPMTPPQSWTLTAADGRKRVFARWWDAWNVSSAVASDTILLDRSDPRTSALRASIVAGGTVVDSRVPILLTWRGSDATCGVARYRLSVSRAGGAWKRTGDATTSKQAVRHLKVGTTYRFRVRAVDRAGNVGSWTTGGSFRVVGSAAHPRIVLLRR
jgi:hypothetical protein